MASGADVRFFDFAPSYPGANITLARASKVTQDGTTDEGALVEARFSTLDSPDEVRDFYRSRLRSSGFARVDVGPDGPNATRISASSQGPDRMAEVIITSNDGPTHVLLISGRKI